jgi:serine/threonine protein kinase
VDIYSFGMILFELETGEIPFANMDVRAIKKKLRE